MDIRKSTLSDLPRMMEIYAAARRFMADHGNPDQWGPTNWPPEALLRQDIARGKSYVVTENEIILATFFYDAGRDIEPTYRVIEGSWRDDRPFGVVHRIAVDSTRRGVGSFALNWAYSQCGHLKIDTHGDNTVMQGLLEKLGFEKRGVIHVEEDDYPRFAYEK